MTAAQCPLCDAVVDSTVAFDRGECPACQRPIREVIRAAYTGGS